MRIGLHRTVLDAVTQIVKPNRRLRAHDIRYGAAEDMCSLPGNANMSMEEIGEELNHSAHIVPKRQWTMLSVVQKPR